MVKKDPIELKIIILLFAIFGILTVALSAYYLTNSELLGEYQSLSYIVLLIGFIELLAVYGLYKKIYWGWILGFTDCIAGITLSIFLIMINKPGAVGIISSAICLFLLIRPNVRKHFKK